MSGDSQLRCAEPQCVCDHGGDLKLIATAAIIRFRTKPKVGKSTPAANGDADCVVDEREEQILADVLHGRKAQMVRAQDPAQIAF